MGWAAGDEAGGGGSADLRVVREVRRGGEGDGAGGWYVQTVSGEGKVG